MRALPTDLMKVPLTCAICPDIQTSLTCTIQYRNYGIFAHTQCFILSGDMPLMIFPPELKKSVANG